MARTLHSRIASTVSSLSTNTATDRDNSPADRSLTNPSHSALVVEDSSDDDDRANRNNDNNHKSDGEEGRRPSGSMLKALLATRDEEMYIELAEPHRTYGPGDLVRGQVILALSKPTKTLFASIKFSGQVLVNLNKSRSKEYLFRDYLVFRGTTTDGKIEPGTQISTDGDTKGVSIPSRVDRKLWKVETMPAGRHVFEFEFQMPAPSLPSTVDFGRGSIVYTLRCDHQKPRTLLGRSHVTSRKDVSVMDAIDVAQFASPRRRAVDFDPKSKRREGTGKIEATVDVSRYGYMKGETITPVIRVTHYKPIKNLQGAIVTLCRMSRFDSPDMAPQTFRKDLAQNVTPLLVDPQTLEYKVSPRVRIPPDAFPTINQAGPVSFRYYIEVMLDLNSKTTVFQMAPTDAATTYTGDDGAVMIETEALRRERGVYRVQFEIIIGTRDSRAGYTEPARTQSMHSGSRQSDGRTSSRGGDGLSLPPPSINAATASSYPVMSKQEMLRREQALLPSEPPPDDDGPEEEAIVGRAERFDYDADMARAAPAATSQQQQYTRYTATASSSTASRARSYSNQRLASPLASSHSRSHSGLRPSQPPDDDDDDEDNDEVGYGEYEDEQSRVGGTAVLQTPVPQPPAPDVVRMLQNVAADSALPTYARRSPG